MKVKKVVKKEELVDSQLHTAIMQILIRQKALEDVLMSKGIITKTELETQLASVVVDVAKTVKEELNLDVNN